MQDLLRDVPEHGCAQGSRGTRQQSSQQGVRRVLWLSRPGWTEYLHEEDSGADLAGRESHGVVSQGEEMVE